jgi:transposase-like protein
MEVIIGVPERRPKFTPEFKDEAVKLVIETSRPIAEVAREIRVNEGTLGNWVNKYRVDHADEESPLTVSERARLRELERENRELRMKAEFLGKAAAFPSAGVTMDSSGGTSTTTPRPCSSRCPGPSPTPCRAAEQSRRGSQPWSPSTQHRCRQPCARTCICSASSSRTSPSYPIASTLSSTD